MEDLKLEQPKKRGRPSKYQEDFPEKLEQFFSRPLFHKEVVETIHFKAGGSKDVYGFIPNDPPYFSDWCKSVGITQAIMDEWVSEDSKFFKPDFFVAYNRAKELQKQFIVNNCLAMRTNAPMSIFLLKNIAGMRDEAYITGKGFGGNTYVQVWNSIGEKEKELDEFGRIRGIKTEAPISKE